MRVVIATQAERSHFHSLVPLAWALSTAGHEVRVASHADLMDAVAGAGLTGVRVGSSSVMRHVMRRAVASAPEFDLSRPDEMSGEELARWNERVVPWWWRVVNDPIVADLVAFCRWWRPQLVIWEPVTFAGPIAAQACGAAHGRLLWSVDVYARLRGRFLDGGPVADPLAEWLGRRAGAYGLRFSEELTHGQFTLDHMPASLRMDGRPPAERVPVRYVPYNGRAVVPAWVHARRERPRVCVSLGNTAHEKFGGYAVSVGELLEALGDLDVEVVATLPAKEQARLGRVPGNVRLVEFVPLHALAPTCAAMIVQGGGGTVCTALFYGVPLLVVPHPHVFDQPLFGRRLTELGAGLTLPPDQVSPQGVRRMLTRLLSEPGFGGRTRRIREEMVALPAPARVVPELEQRARAAIAA
ncbi:activator-dependent family glycosyltransferase [Nonomuraea sp. CA-218870]|uniref:activator-dependent family glycosyltransferase n=1 Tax=Nonomuraea sp. CA-218870 TaxID=3239998 RepID=UPI003D8F879F